MLYPQNGDRIVAVDFVTSFHPAGIDMERNYVAVTLCIGVRNYWRQRGQVALSRIGRVHLYTVLHREDTATRSIPKKILATTFCAEINIIKFHSELRRSLIEIFIN